MPLDDRRACRACARHRNGFCKKLRIGCVPELLHRCADFMPLPDDEDQRTGTERWRGMDTLHKRTAAAVRALPKLDKRLKHETQVRTLLTIQGRACPERGE